MDKYGRLGDGGFAEVFIGALEHEVGDAETEDFVGFFEEFACLGAGFVEVFTHAYELGALAGENVCFHCDWFIKFLQGFGWGPGKVLSLF